MKLSAIMTAITIASIGYGKSFIQNPQPTLDDCEKFKSLYFQYLKAGMYEDSHQFWLKAYDYCEESKTLDSTFFINGRAIYYGLRKSIPKTDTIRLKELNDSIKWIYEKRLLIERNAL